MITRPYTRLNGLETIPFPTVPTCIANIWGVLLQLFSDLCSFRFLKISVKRSTGRGKGGLVRTEGHSISDTQLLLRVTLVKVGGFTFTFRLGKDEKLLFWILHKIIEIINH